MSSRKLPVVLQRVRLTADYYETSLDHAHLAQEYEEHLGDLVEITEIRSDIFETHHLRLSVLHSALLELYSWGFVPLEDVTNISRYWDHLILEELGNRDLRTQFLVLEEFYDNLHDRFSTRASHFELLLLTLLAMRDELLLRNQANNSPTPLGHVHLDSD